jgi:hypothetical protein
MNLRVGFGALDVTQPDQVISLVTPMAPNPSNSWVSMDVYFTDTGNGMSVASIWTGVPPTIVRDLTTVPLKRYVQQLRQHASNPKPRETGRLSKRHRRSRRVGRNKTNTQLRDSNDPAKGRKDALQAQGDPNGACAPGSP